MSDQQVQAAVAEKSARETATIIYALQASSLLIGITMLVAIIMNYVKKSDVKGTLAESHFRWQIRTFWFSLLWGVIGLVTIFILIGWLILLANTVWVIYRIVRGWMNLSDGKPMYAQIA